MTELDRQGGAAQAASDAMESPLLLAGPMKRPVEPWRALAIWIADAAGDLEQAAGRLGAGLDHDEVQWDGLR